jgi:hypothetical protein
MTTIEQSDSPIRTATQRAAGSGWSMHPPATELTNEILVLHLAIDCGFWQALARSGGWPEWEVQRQDFIDYLADGGNPASFFEHLLNSPPDATPARRKPIDSKTRQRKGPSRGRPPISRIGNG